MLPQSLRGKLLLLMTIVAVVPLVCAGYLITVSAEKALVTEKQHKLYGAARILDEQFTGTYEDILRSRGALGADKQTQLTVLNEALRSRTDKVAAAYPGIGVGYYSKELDAIVTYGPSNIYEDRVGMPISESHEGRLVMATGVPRIQEGLLVRGSIMNAMEPIRRDGQIIGYIWANELTSDIMNQIADMKRQIYLLILISLLLALTAIFFLVHRFSKDIETVVAGVGDLSHDLSQPLPTLPGEVGVIAAAVNSMAGELAEKKQREAQVQAAERMAAVGEVAAGLAHEIRNPLMAIKGFAQLIHEGITETEQEEYAAIIVRETDRLNRLVEELLCLSRPSAASVEPVLVREALEDTLSLIAAKASKRQIVISDQIPTDLPLVLVEPERLKQVFLNLLLNAVQAIGQQGTIEITAGLGQNSSEVAVCIKDTGRGIASEDFTKIFDPFFTTKPNGTGLGLSVARRLVENWGGQVDVESIDGEGSSFTLTLPVAGDERNE
ncbi:MAG: ATP-binding protein [Sporomusaceae bacterium]|nr:ATP-binding protein [Sporomusaceae bacterium]